MQSAEIIMERVTLYLLVIFILQPISGLCQSVDIKLLNLLVSESGLVFVGKVEKIYVQETNEFEPNITNSYLGVTIQDYISFKPESAVKKSGYSQSAFTNSFAKKRIDLQVASAGVLKNGGDDYFEIGYRYIFFVNIDRGPSLIVNSFTMIPAVHFNAGILRDIRKCDSLRNKGISGNSLIFPPTPPSVKAIDPFEQ